MLSPGSSLQYCDKLPDNFELLPLYSIKFDISISGSRSLALSTCVLFTSVTQSVVKGAQLLKYYSFIIPTLSYY